MLMAGLSLYSSSPPAVVWCTQSAHSSSLAHHLDVDSHSRPTHHHNTVSRQVVGGLSGLFSGGRSPSQAAVSDVLDSSFACASGMVRSPSLDNFSHNGGAWDCGDSRAGSLSTYPHLVRMKERSPVSVLHGPLRTSHQNSPIFSLVGFDSSVATSGLPPLDPHLDRHNRRKGAWSVDELSPISRSVGFDVGSANSPKDDSALFERSLHNSKGTLGPDKAGENVFNPFNGEKQDVQEARRRFTRLARGASGLLAAFRTSKSPLTAEELLADAQERHIIFSDSLVLRAFEIAEEAHRGQMRRSGGLYLAHCVETALLLADTGADRIVVAAGLVHDTLDDTTLDEGKLGTLLGREIQYLVSGVSKLSAFSQLARNSETAGNPEEADRLRTMFLAMVDARVVLIKLADRLHNLRTLDALAADKQLRIAEETLEIFAPLASRLGIWSWKAEMEDICFRHVKPREYEELASKMTAGWQKGVVMSSIQQLEEALRIEGVEFSDICGRPKNLYSIYSKMIRKGRDIDEIFDVRGLRLIVKDRESCFAALQVVHRLWSHCPTKFKDYITEPKANGYQSLHTVVWSEDGHPLEVQIRTTEMHHQAEFGMAAHWRYKENNSKHSSFVLQKVEWARWVLTWHSEILDTKLRVSPLEADLRPPCPFPFHEDKCPYADVCSLPPQSDEDPLFVIVLKDQNMIVQELAPGSTTGDLLIERTSDRDSISAYGNRTSSRKDKWLKVNHQLVEDCQQRLKMGDFVEIAVESQAAPVMVPLSKRPSELTQAQIDSMSAGDKPCGKIALEFQREQLKRLYLDGSCGEDSRRGPPPQEKNASVVSLS